MGMHQGPRTRLYSTEVVRHQPRKALHALCYLIGVDCDRWLGPLLR
jgi:hypothetical protein